MLVSPPLVTDPARVRGLSLGVAFRGGVIVYLNGKDIARRHFPRGAKGREALAEGYPAEAFTPENGWQGKKPRHPRMEIEEELQLRTRSVDIPIPQDQLRKGLNVLALEIIRAPYHKVVEENRGKRGSRYCPYYLVFNTCQIDLDAYRKDHPGKHPPRPDTLSFDDLIGFFRDHVWTDPNDRKWVDWAHTVRQKRNIIHALRDRDTGPFKTFRRFLRQYLEFIDAIDSRVPYP